MGNPGISALGAAVSSVEGCAVGRVLGTRDVGGTVRCAEGCGVGGEEG